MHKPSGDIPRFSVRRAVATYLREDDRQVENDRRYKPTRTYCHVYTNGEEYLTATRGNRKPRNGPRTGGMNPFEWERVADSGLPAVLDWTIWRHVEPDGEE